MYYWLEYKLLYSFNKQFSNVSVRTINVHNCMVNNLLNLFKEIIRDADISGHAKMFTEAPFTIAKAQTDGSIHFMNILMK